MIYSFVVTVIFTLIALLAFRKYFYFSALVPLDGLSILIMVAAASFPFLFYRLIQKCCFPTKVDIVIREAKIKNKRLKMQKKMEKKQLIQN